MSRKSKFEDEKNRLDKVKKRLDETIEDMEKVQCVMANNKDYSQALLYQNMTKVLRDIRIECRIEKPKEGKKENE